MPSGLPALHIALIQAGCGWDSPASATATSALLHLQPMLGQVVLISSLLFFCLAMSRLLLFLSVL